MNAKALSDYLAAAAAGEPAASFSGPRELAAAVLAAAPAAEWEVSVSGADAALLRLTLRAHGALDAAARALLPAAFRPGLDAVWNSKTAAWLPPKPGRSRPALVRKFSPALFDEPVASALAAFHALTPIREVRAVPGRPGWTLLLAVPPAWPLFLRCDVAAAFAPRAAALSLLLRDARVVALDFDGGALWARVAG